MANKWIHISDTHGKHSYIKWKFDPANAEGIIHSGDFSQVGGKNEVKIFLEWFAALPCKYKILIAGNHDKSFDKKFWSKTVKGDRWPVEFGVRVWLGELMDWFKSQPGCFYLQDEALALDGVNFYGSPYSKWYSGDYWAFNCHPGTDFTRELYDKIPENTDVLITHGPPLGKLDYTYAKVYAGGEELRNRIEVVKPKYHLFGHIHESYGETFDGTTTFLNSSIVTLEYEPDNEPQVFEI